MSQLKSEAPRKRRRFTEEFKQDAVRLVVNEGYTFAVAAKAVGVGEQSLMSNSLTICSRKGIASRRGAQTIVETPMSRAYSNAFRISASPVRMETLPTLSGISPASRNIRARCFRSSLA